MKKKTSFFILFLFLICFISLLLNKPLFTLLTKVRDYTYSELHFNSDKKPHEHSIWNYLLKKNISNSGKVSYTGFLKDSIKLKEYLELLSIHYPNDNWSKKEKLAYWINSYNANTILLVLKNWPLKSIKEIGDGFGNPWNINFIFVGNKIISLEDIEHRILRKTNNPFIHFAINCASISCPKLLNEAYTANTLDHQLKSQFHSFITDSTKNQFSSRTLRISKIFKWFESDFEKNGDLIDFLNQSTDLNIKKEVEIEYLDYNWSLNN